MDLIVVWRIVSVTNPAVVTIKAWTVNAEEQLAERKLNTCVVNVSEVVMLVGDGRVFNQYSHETMTLFLFV